MLIELTITDFAIIDRLRLSLGPHFDVFTGETGAGKSIIIDAISVLLGERAAPGVVRAGADHAIVEGIFDITGVLSRVRDTPMRDPHPDDLEDAGEDQETLGQVLTELGIEPEDGLLIISREILSSGRGIARIGGRAVPLAILQRLARFLVDIHGQSAHLALLRPEQHVLYLDRYAGTVDLREQVRALVSDWHATRRELDRLHRDEREIERRVELLRYQVNEIEAARLQPAEIETLETDRLRLANAERLIELAITTHNAIAGDTDTDSLGALDLLASAEHALAELQRLDATLAPQEEILQQASFLLQDIASTVRTYQDTIAAEPERQAQVEERLDLIARLRRKYGNTIEEILAYGAAAAAELDELTHREERTNELQQREHDLRARIGALSSELSRQRSLAAKTLSSAMEHQLDDLNMRRARFEVQILHRADPHGVPAVVTDGAAGEGIQQPERFAFSDTGIDYIEFLISPNPGEPLKPLARIASGGETSRLMLALKTILAEADIVPTLIFDEIDAGISGKSGQTVGEKLWQLGRSHQVLCVTHLPQIAALGDHHYRVAKQIEGDRTLTQVEQLDWEERMLELSQMLGGRSTSASRTNASELLDRSREWKQEVTAAPTGA